VAEDEAGDYHKRWFVGFVLEEFGYLGLSKKYWRRSGA